MKERTTEIPGPVDRLSIGELKDRLESLLNLPRIFIELLSNKWMCSGQRLDSVCPFQPAHRCLFDVDRDDYVRLSVFESSARRWALDLEKVKQKASLSEKQLFSLQARLEEEKIRAADELKSMRHRVLLDQEKQREATDSTEHEHKELLEQMNLLKLNLDATRESAQTKLRVLEAEALTSQAERQTAVRELIEKHNRDTAELQKQQLHQIEALNREHCDQLDQVNAKARRLEDEVEKYAQKLELSRAAMNTEKASLEEQLRQFQTDLETAHQKLAKAKAKKAAAPATVDAAAPAVMTQSLEEVAKLEKKLEKLTERIEEKEEELHAKQQLLRRVRFLVDQMNCIVEKKRK